MSPADQKTMREGEHDQRPGWDITFPAPKSVSLEALAVGDRREILAYIEKRDLAYGRARTHPLSGGCRKFDGTGH